MKVTPDDYGSAASLTIFAMEKPFPNTIYEFSISLFLFLH